MSDVIRASGFFRTVGWVLLLLVIAGFGSIQLLTPELTSPMRLTLALHTLIFLGWYALLIIQPTLINKRNFKRHRQIGQLSMGLSVALVAIGLVIICEAYQKPGWSIAGMGPQSSVMFPFTDMVFFSLLYWLAIARRKDVNTHMRLMLFAGIIMLDPALARLMRTIGAPPPLLSGVELGLIIATLVHDRRTLGRFHGATWFGTALVVVTYPLVFGLSQTGAWTSLITSVLGSPPPS